MTSKNKKDLLLSLIPIFKDDHDEWLEVIEILNDEQNSFVWSASAGMDTKPSSYLKKGLHKQNINSNIFLMTDYAIDIKNAFKEIYDNFNNDNQLLSNNDDYWLEHQLYQFEILQIIPLTLFNNNQLKNIRHSYTTYHRSVTNSVIPDDVWHFIFLHISTRSNDFFILYGLMENIVFWKEVIEKYNLNISILCAFNVAGKSGSTYAIHSQDGPLFQVIKQSTVQKPLFWIFDRDFGLPTHWHKTELNTIECATTLKTTW